MNTPLNNSIYFLSQALCFTAKGFFYALVLNLSDSPNDLCLLSDEFHLLSNDFRYAPAKKNHTPLTKACSFLSLPWVIIAKNLYNSMQIQILALKVLLVYAKQKNCVVVFQKMWELCKLLNYCVIMGWILKRNFVAFFN